MTQFNFGGFDFDFQNQGQPFAFAGSDIDPFAGLPQGQDATEENLQSFFQERGQRITPSGEIAAPGQSTQERASPNRPVAPDLNPGNNTIDRSRIANRDDLNAFDAAQPGASEQLTAALGFDIGNRQAAAQRQFQRNQQEIEGFRTALGEGTDSLLETADQTAESVVGGAEDDRSDILSRLDRIEEDFVDRTDRDLAATVGGIERRFRNTQRLLESGIKPDGTRMTSQEQQEFATRIATQRSEQVRQAAVQIRSQFNNQRANLGVQLAGIADRANQQVQQARATSSGIRNAARLQALQFELQGRGQLADMVRSNRESVTSLFASLSSLAQLQSSPGFNEQDSLFSSNTAR